MACLQPCLLDGPWHHTVGILSLGWTFWVYVVVMSQSLSPFALDGTPWMCPRPGSLLVSSSYRARGVITAQDWGVLSYLLGECETQRLGVRGIHKGPLGSGRGMSDLKLC